MTPEEEDALVRAYCHKRPLVRPETGWNDLLKFFLTRGLSAVAAGLVSLCFHGGFLFLFLIAFLLLALIDLDKLLILCIEIYQHYAPEALRRRCQCKPTCSEYAIACLRKYSLFPALRKIYIRLTKTCTGFQYHIDEP